MKSDQEQTTGDGSRGYVPSINFDERTMELGPFDWFSGHPGRRIASVARAAAACGDSYVRRREDGSFDHRLIGIASSEDKSAPPRITCQGIGRIESMLKSVSGRVNGNS